jgi:hypothetical protein
MPTQDAPLLATAVFVLFLAAATDSMAVEAKAQPWSSATQMAEAAQALIATLEPARREQVVFPMDAATRSNWSNLPTVMVEPPGLMIGAMSDAQRQATHDLLRASLSSQGYAKVTSVMRLEDLLREIDAAELAGQPENEETQLRRAFIQTYDYGNYAVALFGEPGSEQWGWKLAGHHAAANFTVSNDRVAFTPTFLGSAPMVVQEGRFAGLMALPHEGGRGIDLMRSLTAAQQQIARIAPEVAPDVFEGAGRKASLQQYEGIKASEFSADQMRLLQALVEEYVGNAEFDAAEAQLEAIRQAGWGELRFSWRGPVDPVGRFYYRVHGPRLLIEYNRQDANHDHTVMRDPQNDYGEDWLGRHIEEHHPSMEEAMENARRRASAVQPE